MLVTEDGRTWGGVSGGCLEADVIFRAQRAIADNAPDVACYETHKEEDRFFGVGTGCDGVIYILIEPIAPTRSEPQQIGFLRDFLAQRHAAACATLFRAPDDHSLGLPAGLRSPIGLRWTVSPDGRLAGGIGDSRLDDAIFGDLHRALRAGTSVTKTYATAHGEIKVLLEVLQPPLSLAVFGAGHDAVPVVRGAKELGWHVALADHRPAMAQPTRFPGADTIFVGGTSAAVEQAKLDSQTCVLLMTHNYPHDLELLPLLLRSSARYVGVLGSRQRIDHLFDHLHKQGETFTVEQLARLHAPVGLDIGAETPEEIALSVLAEIKAVLSNRHGGLLRERQSPIHISESDA
jgi:xanthine/CO dehydrogenase XdhC/CoxF family maturation factor